jgi:large subunit ribosomal protein L1
MAKLTKRRQAIEEKLSADINHPLEEALKVLKGCATAKFDESVDIAINLGIDARKSDQNVRGATVMPRGTGKTVRIAVFAEGEQAEAATAAGADVVGMDDLADSMKKGDLNYDVVIAAPDAMRVVGALGPVLGPRGLMPNPKVGTVAADVAGAVNNAKAGQVQFRNDKSGIIHCSVGKASFDTEALIENINMLMDALNKAKPSSAKGQYIKRVSVSTTMGPGINVDRSTVTAVA